MSDVDTFVEVLMRRHGILAAICEEQKPRYDLVDELAASKSTVYKGIKQLESLGLIESTADGLKPTVFGVMARQRYDELAQLSDFEDILTSVPVDAIGPEAVAGATIITPESHSIDRHFVYVEDLLHTANRLRVCSPILSPRYVSLFRKRLLDSDLEAELIFETEIIEHLLATYADEFDHLDDESVTLWQTDEHLPFGLVIATTADGKRMAVEVRNGDMLRGLVVNDSEDSLHWAECTYTKYKRAAVRVDDDRIRSG